jgi:hypothetical protein
LLLVEIEEYECIVAHFGAYYDYWFWLISQVGYRYVRSVARFARLLANRINAVERVEVYVGFDEKLVH